MEPYESTMIFRPVSPVSAFGPPISNRPVGLTRILTPSASSSISRRMGPMTSDSMSGASRVASTRTSVVLPGSVRSEQPEDLALLHGERDPIQRLDGLVPLVQILDDDRVHDRPL